MANLAGMFVKLPNGLGIGKLERVDGEIAYVRLFHSVAEQEVSTFARSALCRTFLSKGTRVYFNGDGFAPVGRVVRYHRGDDGSVAYDVQFPNRTSKDCLEADLDVRCWRARGNPADILSAGAAESQWLHDRRLQATQQVCRALAGADGVTSFLSSGVEMVRHQIGAVRRVLSDPVLRYLLADEVGMGKTIEAGMIIRQCLLDDPTCHVAVLVPTAVVDQWEQELESKFYVAAFAGSVEVVAHDEIHRIEQTPTLLVIDEAHHVVGDESPLHKAIATLAQRSPRLLLLSATPALADASKFLQLLRLLDHRSYGSESIADFEAKLKSRREFGRLLLGLVSGGSGLVLRRRAAQVLELFPNDAMAVDLAQRLDVATRTEEGDADELAGMLRSHISDAYRVNQRVIRGRRSDANGWEFQPRGPTPKIGARPSLLHIRSEGDEDRRAPNVSDCLEEWRNAAREHSLESALLTSGFATRYRNLLESFSTGISEIESAISLELARTNSLTFPGETDHLSAIAAALCTDPGPRVRIDVVEDCLRMLHKSIGGHTKGGKILAFTSSTAIAEQIHARMSYGVIGEVHLLTLNLSSSEARNCLDQFKESKSAWLLVLDKSGEEGLNLAFADAIVHVDLPFSAARVEQRIGRVDRFGRRKSELRQRIVLPFDEEGSVWSAWQSVMAEAFCVFNESVSDVQFILGTLEDELIQAAFNGGAAALENLSPSIRSRILAEREAQDEQYALDRVAGSFDGLDEFIERMEDVEADEAECGASLEAWLVDSLQIERSYVSARSRDVFRLKWTGSTLVPSDPWRDEFGLENQGTFTWRRRVALENPGVQLLRPGTPLIDGSERFMRWDDRGTTFATWRTDPDWPERGDPWIGFRLCFLVEPSMPQIADIFATSDSMGGLRRAQHFLAPSYWVLHVDIDGAVVDDPARLSILEKPYQQEKTNGRFDVNLGSRLHLIYRVVERALLPGLCMHAQREGYRALLAREDVAAKLAAAAELAKSDASRRNLRLRTRGTWDGNPDSVQAEIALNERIALAVAQPSVRLDAMGLFVVTSETSDLTNGFD